MLTTTDCIISWVYFWFVDKPFPNGLTTFLRNSSPIKLAPMTSKSDKMFFQNVTLRLSTCVMLFLNRYSGWVNAMILSAVSLRLRASVLKILFALIFAPLLPCDFALRFLNLHFRRQSPLYPLCNCTNCPAVACSRPPAALVSFQRHQPCFPPTQNVNSAPLAELPARHFGG